MSRIIYIKDGFNKKFVIIDAGMNDLIRPALYGAVHRVEPLKMRQGRSIKADIVGPICENSDTFIRGMTLTGLREGDILCLFTAGAYGHSMSSNYNSRLRPAEVLVKGNQEYLIRERESYRDLWRKQKSIDLKNIKQMKI